MCDTMYDDLHIRNSSIVYSNPIFEEIVRFVIVQDLDLQIINLISYMSYELQNGANIEYTQTICNTVRDVVP